MNDQPTRFEQLGTLFTAIMAVIITGQIPEEPASEPTPPFEVGPLRAGAKPRVIVPLASRYSALINMPKNRVRDTRTFAPMALLRLRFGLGWSPEVTGDLLRIKLMPSSLLQAIPAWAGIEDVDSQQRILDERPKKHLRWATRYQANWQYRSEHGLGSYALLCALWRFPGNPDIVWFTLREALREAQSPTNGGAR